MDRFLIQDNQVYTYEDLLAEINSLAGYYPLYQESDLFKYFVNLVWALVCDQDLVLIDADVKACEMRGIEKSDVNAWKSLSKPVFGTIESVVEKLLCSTSKITIFTSGTTGQPKKVSHSIQSLTRFVRKGERYREQVWAYAYNPTHMAGLQVFFQAFVNQNELVNVFNKSREEIYQIIRDNVITHISATPTFYRLLLPFMCSFDFVQRVTLGGEKSDSKLYESIKKIFPNAKINNVYASTEAGSLFAAKGDCFQIPESIKDKFLVKDEELLIHRSFLGQSESFSFDGDYYHSGDLIEWVDEGKGLFRFKSRKNELINVGGYKVNPNETEAAIMEMDGVQQAVVFGKANSVLGNVLCAEVMLEPGILITESDLRSFLKSRLQDFKIPRRIKFVDSFSLTRTGKIKR